MGAERSGAGRAWEGSRARLGRLRCAGAVGPAWERGLPAVFGAAERVLPGEKRGRAAPGEVSVRRGGVQAPPRAAEAAPAPLPGCGQGREPPGSAPCLSDPRSVRQAQPERTLLQPRPCC